MKSNTNLIIIDSNFILLPFQFKIDYFNEIRLKIEGEIKFIILQQILNELESKKRRQPKASKFTQLLDSGLTFLDKNKENYDIKFLAKIKKDDETTDEFLIRVLRNLKKESQNVYLATNDSKLRKKARELNIGTIFLRQKKYLSIERG